MTDILTDFEFEFNLKFLAKILRTFNFHNT